MDRARRRSSTWRGPPAAVRARRESTPDPRPKPGATRPVRSPGRAAGGTGALCATKSRCFVPIPGQLTTLTKGKVESGVKYFKCNFRPGRDSSMMSTSTTAHRVDATIADCGSMARPMSAHRSLRAGAARAAPHCEPAELPPRGPAARIVAEDSLVSLDTNRYSVPFTLIGQTVHVHRHAGELALPPPGHAAWPSTPSSSAASGPDPARHGPGASARTARRRPVDRGPLAAPPGDRPVVEVRDLALYDALLGNTEIAAPLRPSVAPGAPLRSPRSLGARRGVRMTAAQLERLQEHLQRLRLFKSRDRLEALLQDATGEGALLCRLPRPGPHRGSRLQDRQARHHAHPARPLPLRQGPGELRLHLPALARQEADPDAEHLPLHRARRESCDPRPARSSDIMPTSLCR